MAAIFISHSSHDNAHADTIKAWLTECGFENVFLDFDDASGIMPGERWERRLYDEISRSQAVLLLHTPAWLKSKWCFVEFAQARALGKPIFPIIYTPLDGVLIAPELQVTDLTDWNAGGRDRLLHGLRGATGELARGFRWDRTRAPYPGINAFESADAPIFFGRDDEVRDVVAMLDARRVQGGDRFVLIQGGSGSGKSSLLRAGVIPLLRRDAACWQVLPPIRPQRGAVAALSKSIAAAMGDDAAWPTWARRLCDDPRGAFKAAEERLFVGTACSAHILLAIDQFEEVGGCDRADRDAFLRAVWEIINPSSDLTCMVLGSARTDACDALLSFPELSGPGLSLYPLRPMPLARLPRLIEGPASVASVNVERELVQRIVADVPNSEALPLLAFTLREMYDRFARRSSQLKLADYEALGDPAAAISGIENAIRHRAEDLVRARRPSERELTALRAAFIPGLVRLDAAGTAFRRTARLADLPAEAESLLRALVDARLLALASDEGGAWIEVSHEALFRVWPALAGWISGEREFLLLFQRVEEQERIWLDAPDAHKADALLQGFALARVRQVHETDPDRFRRLVPFIRLSLEHDEEKLEEQRSQREAVFISQSRMLARMAIECVREGNTGTAIQLTLEALPSAERPRPYVPEARAALESAVRTHRERGRVVFGAEVTQCLFSQDGRKVWSVVGSEGRVEITTLEGHTTATVQVEGELLDVLNLSGFFVGVADDRNRAIKNVLIWTADGLCISKREMPSDSFCKCALKNNFFVITDKTFVRVTSMSGVEILKFCIADVIDQSIDQTDVPEFDAMSTDISVDESWIVTSVTRGHCIVLWRSDGTMQRRLGFESDIARALFAPDGSLWIFTEAGTLAIIDPDGIERTIRRKIPANKVGFPFLRFLPDGSLCAVSIFSQHDGRLSLLLDRSGSVVRSSVEEGFYFGPQGALVVRSENTVRVEGADGGILAIFTPTIRGGNFEIDASAGSLITWSGRRAEVWSLDGRELANLAHDATINDAVVSDDGGHAVTCSLDGVVRIWNLSLKPEELLRLPAGIKTLSYHGGDQLLLASDHDSTMQVCERGGRSIATGRYPYYLELFEAWEPIDRTGSRLLSLVSGGGQIRELRTGQEWLLDFPNACGSQFSATGDAVLLWKGDDSETQGGASVWSTVGERLLNIEHGTLIDARFASTEGTVVATVGRQTACSWKLDGGSLASVSTEHKFFTPALGWDGEVLLTHRDGPDGRPTVIDVVGWSGNVLASIGVDHGAWSDRRFLITTSDKPGKFDVWSLDGRHLGRTWTDFHYSYRSSPDRTRIALQTGGTLVELRDGTDGSLIAELRHQGNVRNMAIAEDSSALLTIDYEGNVCCWSRDGDLVLRWKEPGRVDLAAVSRGGASIALQTGDSAIKVLPGPSPLDGLMRRGRALMPHALTARQREHYSL